MFVVIYGHFVAGHSIVGPFEDPDAAHAWCGDRNAANPRSDMRYSVVELTDPEDV